MSKQPTYKFDVSVYADVAVVRLRAQRYLSDSQDEFLKALRSAAEQSSAKKIVVDLSDAELLTSGPIGAMVSMHRQMSRQGGGIVAAGGGDFAVRVLSFAANIIDHFSDVAVALSSPQMSPEAAAVYAQEN